jgi:serine/threonine protein kinase
MPLASRARLGPYEIQSAIGVGGMSEVYRARDLKLGRDVAAFVRLRDRPPVAEPVSFQLLPPDGPTFLSTVGTTLHRIAR